MRSGRSKNLRRYDRQAVKAGLRMYSESANGQFMIAEGRCLDVSVAGLQMSLFAPVQPRQRVTVKVDELKIHTSGHIRHCRRGVTGFKAGIEFTGKLPAL